MSGRWWPSPWPGAPSTMGLISAVPGYCESPSGQSMSLPSALAATAWHRRLLCPDGASGPIGNFVTAFRNQGPEKGFA